MPIHKMKLAVLACGLLATGTLVVAQPVRRTTLASLLVGRDAAWEQEVKIPAAPVSKAKKETPAEASARLAEQLKRNPGKLSKLDRRRGLFLMDLVQGDVTMIADEPDPGSDSCGSPKWSHDGRRILFDAMPDQEFHLLRIKAIEIGAQRPTMTDLGLGARPTLSPDDQRIAFLLHHNAIQGAQPGVWVMQADGSNRHVAGEAFGMPFWSPDGRQFLIVGFQDPRQLTLINLENPNSHNLKIPGHQVFGWPSWADVGTVAAIVGTEGNGDSVALLDVSNPQQARIKEVLWKRGKDLAVRPLWPVYSHSTRRCIFVGIEPKGMALYSVEPGQPGRAKRLEAGELDLQIGGLAFSPDGRYLLFCSTRPKRRQP